MPIELELDGLFSDELAVTATYTPSGGEASEIQVIIIPGEDGKRPGSIAGNGGVHILPVECNSRHDFHHGRTRQIATVLVKASDISSPAYRDTIEIDGVTWTVKEIYAE